MAKGFGNPKQGDLGYVLLLLPRLKGYAADFSMGKGDEEFIASGGRKKEEGRRKMQELRLIKIIQPITSF